MNGEVFGMFESYPGSVFNSFGVEGDDVHTLTLKSVGATAQGWISLLEVSAPRIFSVDGLGVRGLWIGEKPPNLSGSLLLLLWSVLD